MVNDKIIRQLTANAFKTQDLKNQLKQFKEREMSRVKAEYENKMQELVRRDLKKQNQSQRDQYQSGANIAKPSRNKVETNQITERSQETSEGDGKLSR